MIYNESDFNKNWNTKSLNELGLFSRGKSRHRPRNDSKLFEGGIYPLVQTGEIKDATLFIDKHTQAYNEFGLKQSKLWESGTLCITIAANIAETAILSYPMCFPDSIVGFIAFDHVSSEIFMYYVFAYIKNSIQRSASGSIQDNINIEYLTNLKFKVPSKPTQDNIAGILFSIDTKIQNNKKIIVELEDVSKTIYDYWFTQFDFPDENGKPYKSSGGKMVYNKKLKREIPFGWEVSTMRENTLFDIIKPGIDEFKRKTYLATADVSGTSISEGEVITFEDRVSRANMQPKLNTVWFAKMKNSVKHLFLNKEMIKLIDNTVLSTGFCGLQCSETSFEYVSSFISNKYFETIKDELAHGATQQAVNNDDLESIFIIAPSGNILDNYHISFKSIYGNISTKIIENKQLAELRDWLLPMLMNGQATVSDKAKVVQFEPKEYEIKRVARNFGGTQSDHDDSEELLKAYLEQIDDEQNKETGD